VTSLAGRNRRRGFRAALHSGSIRRRED
jgi:hypothetical protein